MIRFDINVPVSPEPTPLCEIMQRMGSDKGAASAYAQHNYTRYYHPLFAPHRDEVRRVLELGIFGGASLRGWREYFPNATIYGLDIDKETLFTEDRIVTAYCNSTSRSSVLEALDGLPLFDIIIDDGPHYFDAQYSFWEWSNVKCNGVYICEDLDRNDGRWERWMREGRLVDIPHVHNGTDNKLMVWTP